MSQPPYPGQPYPNDPSSGQPNQGQPPYPGQPQYGQPNYPPTTPYPSSGQPDYGQPSYGQQPQYGQPGGNEYGQQPPYGQQPQYGQQPPYGQPAGGFPPPQAPKKKSRTLPIILISVAIVLVLCIGGITAIVLATRDGDTDRDNLSGLSTTAPTAAPTTEPAEEPTTEPPAASTVSISEPATLGGRKKLTSQQFKAIADQLKSGLASVPGATNSVGALYGDVADQNIVIVAAAEAPIANPKVELEQTFYGAGIGGLKIENITNAPTGALGGAAKCGRSETSGIDMAICTWADEGSVGMIIWYYESVSGAKAEFPKLRAQIEKKN
ncbi:hypothetical protein Aab01nite_16280 [Paractinoplanes abujensis]|uniref:Uncharacterized protein n=1 Tax=Paractinoplanes abujensis TaxID=882441 RepID=A0A7W7CZE2_9ACTN|nr:hypothetical protein [Actinoplanes abujensis]MBB4697487.1 hypothetical protein [Actinoplanes abujensis]GID18038.1 hypothetical protein Aab01nite_16280 [Actinoplanes abujensis]